MLRYCAAADIPMGRALGPMRVGVLLPGQSAVLYDDSRQQGQSLGSAQPSTLHICIVFADSLFLQSPVHMRMADHQNCISFRVVIYWKYIQNCIWIPYKLLNDAI